MSIKKCFNLFKQFDKLDDVTQLICKNVHEITFKNYGNPESLLKFNEKKYRNLYKEWGNLGIFNHYENEITPQIYGMINYNIEKTIFP